jgi:hypothetical protein
MAETECYFQNVELLLIDSEFQITELICHKYLDLKYNGRNIVFKYMKFDLNMIFCC